MSARIKRRTNARIKSTVGGLTGITTTKKSLSQVAQEHRLALKKRTLALTAMPSQTRAAVSQMVEENGAPPDEVTWGAYSGMTAEEEGWMDVDEDEGPVDTSHEGGEYADSIRILISEITSSRHPRETRSGARTRRERLMALRENWKEQMPQLIDAYLLWKHRNAGSFQTADLSTSDELTDANASANSVPSIHTNNPAGIAHPIEEGVRCFDVMGIWTHDRRRLSIVQRPEEPANVSLIHQGLLGCAPIDPAFAFSIDTLELFHRLRRRHPRLGIQAMMRALCDVHGVNYLDSYREQLSIAFDAYLDILRRVKQDVDHALGRDTPDWRIKNACPCCNYKLKDEPPLTPSRLLAMDGNNSAKRVASAGLVDFGQFDSDYFLSREEVDRFKDEVKGRKRKGNEAARGAQPAGSDSEEEDEEEDAPWVPDTSKPGDVTDGQTKATSCTENWKASAEEHHKKALNIYHQTGIFGSACRHHIIEKFCEMIRSGELAKYPIAITNHTLDVHADKDMTIGYDIGCAFTSTTNHSTLAPRILSRRLSFVVNAFHGYAHNRLCQTMFHILYKRGCGIEDLETMERVFSASNNVARTIRYASQFHWAQALDLHFRQWDEEKYYELSKFLFNNYRQALNIIRDYTPEVERMKAVLEATDEDIEGWLRDEHQFLSSLKNEPEERVLEVAYVEALIARDKADEVLRQATIQFRMEVPVVGAADRAHNESATRRLETTRRNAMHAMTVAIQAVNELELKLDVVATWTPHHPQYQETLRYMRTRQFHRALDKIQQLVVQRLLEMTKMNASGMSYKLRTSIGKAMKTRSKAIHTALKKYNALAPQMDPPAPILQWKDVMNYAFVSEFDLLHHVYSHKDISQLPWAVQANREIAAKYYKIRCAHDEIVRLNIECRRLQTHIRDEEGRYLQVIRELTPGSPLLAAEVLRTYENRRRVNRIHQVRLEMVQSLDGFSGWTTPGIRLEGVAAEEDYEEIQHDRQGGDPGMLQMGGVGQVRPAGRRSPAPGVTPLLCNVLVTGISIVISTCLVSQRTH
ncbi:hypothetical protein BDY19DRAFT_981236 [Irpex rosettiformis]|uniref:Uncharacterized protein n=1 Tax=Irpex rosettiformis TaxID=378272 RepID=A0ACB8TM05_9APHY|nr:hypothetical protein BDY19DRAFT_981236 [Irpex rosettiformis]